MKKITLVVFTILAFSLSAVAQHSFPAVTGPTNVAQGAPVTLNINDSANSATAPASSTGTYLSFSVSADWVAGGGGPWSSEADLTVTTLGGSVAVDPPTTGGANSGAATTLTFEGDFTTPYDPTIDGALDIILNQSYGGSDADWSNIVVTIFESPLCFEPTGLTVGSITSTSAGISWTSIGSELNWEVVVQPAGTGVPTGSGTPTMTNPYSATGLTAVTDYEVYVRANCLTDGFSTWVGPVNFTSACDVFVPDYIEDFTTIIPNCWDEADNGDATTGPIDLGAGSWTSDGFLNNGFNGAYKINLYLAAKSDWILSPQFDLTGVPFQVDFDFGIMQWGSSTNAGTLGSDDTVELLISTDNGATWTNLVTFDNTSAVPVTGTQVVYDLTAYSGQIVQFGILGSEGTVDDAADNDIFVDNFRVRAIPSCPEPLGLGVANITGTTADVSWTMGGSETEWEYVVQPAGTGVPTTNGIVVNATTVNLTGLDYSTDYEVYVRANCGGGSYSTWVGPVDFSTTVQVNFTVDCTGTPTNMNYCYVNNETNVFVFTSSDGSPLNLTFNSGQVENGWDELVVYDSDGVTELTPTDFYGNNGDISGNSYQSSGDTISYTITSDGSVSCESSGYTPIDVTVSCATCTNPIVEFALVNDCDNGEFFFVEANITDIGSATTLGLELTDNLMQYTMPATNTGIISMGPYDNGTDIVITVTSLDDGNCTVTSSNFNLLACPPSNDLCIDAEIINCGDSVSGNTTDATENDEPADFCGTGGGAPGVWYEYTGTGDIVTMSLCNSTFDTKIQVWEGDCGALTCVNGNDDSCGLQSEAQFISTVGTTYYVYVFGFGTSTGDYTLDVTCVEPPPPPPNDDCETPTTVIANSDDTCTLFTSGTVWGATDSGQANGCAGSADDDVWFEFEAIATDHAVTINNATGGLSLGIYEGDDCNNLTELYCSPFFGDPTLIANGLTVGNTYLVRVYSTTANPLQDITFDICVFTIPPPIYTSETDYTVEAIIKDVLANENPDCPQIYNITYSTGTDFGATNGIGYFEANGSDWPFEAGLIMTSGDINNAPGPEDEILSDGGFAWPGDADLESQIPNMDAGDSNNASIIEFDFVPIIEHMSFDFIFASEEYGTYQCPGFSSFADGFAFLLTDSNGITTNLAFVPGTVDPISIFTVRDEAYNGNCASVNAEYFDSFYGGGGENPLTSPIDFLGHTVIMTAEADVIPGEEYHIKLVVADDADTAFDSAVFIGAGTFDIGYPDLGEDILLGSGEETCEGNPLTINCGEIPLGAMVEWFMDGELIEGANTQTIQVTETAFYGAEFSYPNGDCALYDEVLIEFYENPEPVAVQETIIRCVGLEVTLEVTVNNSDVPDTLEYYWTYEGVDIQQGPENTYTIVADSDELGEYIVTVIDERGCYGDTIINVVEGVYPIVEAVEPLVDKCINEDATLEATVTNAESLSNMLTYIWYIDGVEMQSSPDNTYVHASGESEAIVTVMVRDEVSQCTDETDISVVYYENANCVDLPQGLSPNGDGFNDCLILDHLEDKEDITQIDIFNRHGIKIYELNDYVDQWCGTDQDGKKMPVGTYFYVIHTKAKEPRTSWIYLNY